MKLFANLRGATSAATLEKAHSELVEQRGQLQTQLDDLKRGLAAAPFEQPDAVEGMRSQISVLTADIELLDGIIEEADKRRRLASEKETEEAAIAVLDAAREKVTQLERDFVELDKHLDAIERILNNANGVFQEAMRANTTCGVVDGWSGKEPPKINAHRVSIPSISLGHLLQPIGQLRQHGVLTWFANMRANGRIK